jgi:hypothetical protein
MPFLRTPRVTPPCVFISSQDGCRGVYIKKNTSLVFSYSIVPSVSCDIRVSELHLLPRCQVFNTRMFANKLFTSGNVPIDLLCQHLVVQFIAFNIGVHFLML